MKHTLTISLSLFIVCGFSQALPNGNPVTNSNQWIKYAFIKVDSGFIPTVRTDTNYKARYYGTEIIWQHIGVDTSKWQWVGYWQRETTSVDSLKFVTHTALNDTLLSYVKIQTQPPTASLSGGYSYEYQNSGTFTVGLPYTAGRQGSGTNIAPTAPIASIIVNGASEPTTGCTSPPCTINGTYNATVTYNTNVSYTNVVTTTDGKTASASTYFSYYHKRYYGFSTGSTPTNTEILAAFQDNSGGYTPLSYTFPQQVADAYLFYVNTSQVSSVTVSGIPATASFNLNTPITVTNANGASYSGYYVTISKNKIGGSGDTPVIFQ
jgi:hypothetical protein